MDNHMKTTVNIPDGLFSQAKVYCSRNGITLTNLLQGALQNAITERDPSKGSFKLADGSFKGEPGLQPGVDLSEWTDIRARAYEGRGGC